MSTHEQANELQKWLEDDWLKGFRHKGKGKSRWLIKTLLKDARNQPWCNSELDVWFALGCLAQRGIIEGKQQSFEHRAARAVKFSEEQQSLLRERVEEPDEGLGLDSIQQDVWRRGLAAGGLKDLSLKDQRALVQGLCSLVAELPTGYEYMTVYEASARYLLGSSKLLGELPRQIPSAFGIHLDRFRRPRAYLLASMPHVPQGVLLIENQQSFNQACRLGLNQRLALVCSYGYGLSLGEALAYVDNVSLMSETPVSFGLKELLTMESITYWGDFDPEGLRIYRTLKARLPSMCLSALYIPMIDAYEQGVRHPLHALTGKRGQRAAGQWGSGLDQEWLSDECVRKWAGSSLPTQVEEHWMGCLDT